MIASWPICSAVESVSQPMIEPTTIVAVIASTTRQHLGAYASQVS